MTTKPDAPASPAGPVWGRRIAGEAGAANVAYCAGWDVRAREAADLELLPWDLWTNRAHCVMLARAGVIPAAALRAILDALDRIESPEGGFSLDPALEDVHLNVETFVEQRAGVEASGLMHTARSRNDQVATDMRLWLRERLLAFCEGLEGLGRLLTGLARRESEALMPGLTHHQPAAWTTLGHWAAAHAQAMSRDLEALLHLAERANVSPLGAAASYGTSWPIDRDYAASLMGFDGVQENSLDCVTNRCEFESRAASDLAFWGQHAATLCQDLILFSSPPWSLMRIGDAFVTGSSIMPQKRNPDFAEVTKAKAALAGSVAAAMLDLTRGDPSGYNREQQWSKYMIMDLFAELDPAPRVIAGAIESLRFDRRRMVELLRHDYLEAADVADFLAQTRAVPFRVAYRWLGEAVRLSEENGIPLVDAVNDVLERAAEAAPLDAGERADLEDPRRLVERRGSQGGPSPQAVRKQAGALKERLGDLRARRRALRGRIDRGRRRLAAAVQRYAASA